jgi:hypothetical protein
VAKAPWKFLNKTNSAKVAQCENMEGGSLEHATLRFAWFFPRISRENSTERHAWNFEPSHQGLLEP